MTLEEKAKEYCEEYFDEFRMTVGDMENAYITGATENGIIWHDLRKAPEDLPPVHSSVLNEDCDKVVYIGEGKWEAYSEYYEKYVEVDPPVAWCELSTFDAKVKEVEG